MTVSTINGVQAELRRVQDNQNKAERPLPLQPSGASLPNDVLSDAIASYAATDSGDLSAVIAQAAQQNQQAAQSTISDAEIEQLTADSANAARQQVEQNPKSSIAAQTNNLPRNLIDLLGE